MKFKEILDKWLKDPKKFLTNIAVIFLIGVLLILVSDLVGNLFGKGKESSNVDKQVKESIEVEDAKEVSTQESNLVGKDYEEKLKRDVENVLSKIQGVEEVSVMIYFEGTSESIPARNSTDTNKKTDEKDKEGGTRTTTENSKNSTVVTTGDGGSNKALIVKETRPTIGGVMIVAKGADNPAIKEEISNSVKTLLSLPANKVFVSPMKKN